MALVGELVAGAALGTLFAELYKGFNELRDETKRFGGRLEILDRTLESLKPLIFKQLLELNQELDLPTTDIEDLERKMTDGKELVIRLSQIRKREYLFVRRSYSNQLVEVDRSLKILLDRLKLQQASDVKKILLVVRKNTAKLGEMEKQNKMLLDILLNVRREIGEVKVTLVTLQSAVESSKQFLELEASTTRLLGEPAVQQQAKNVEETRILVTSTEKALERVKENSVLKVLALVMQRTAVGTILQELFDALYKVKGKYPKLLQFLQPMIEDMQAKYNKVLDHPKEELENFKMLVKKALDLLRFKLCARISYKKHKYGNQLVILDKSLQKLLDILKVMELSNSTNVTTLASVTNMEAVVHRLLDV